MKSFFDKFVQEHPEWAEFKDVFVIFLKSGQSSKKRALGLTLDQLRDKYKGTMPCYW